MQCAACGSTLPAPGAACTVCDPWATPTGSATATLLPPPNMPRIPAGPATFLGTSLPRWYRALIRRNPPVPTADLDAAWRNTLISSAVNVVVLAVFTITSVTAARDHSDSAYQTAVVVFAAGAAVALVVGRVLRRRTWLGRVVAVLGSRPDIGHPRLLQIPAMSRLSTVYNAAQSVGASLCAGFIILTANKGPGVLWIPLLGLLVLTLCQLALLSVARGPVTRLLASPTGSVPQGV
ncbi:hypothetical protein [Actinospica robiniae]|uniref:hypothetical protein n=1 Tax=Actinospica robiniae TaxID=304901 RepID=UPI000426AE59|nr:hypothetical protein [Actinospica robiniae]